MRLRRVELPPDVTGPVYARMESERRRVANELRSLGAAESEQIRADADRQRQVILAEAYRQAQKIKGEGDAKSASIYASAYSGNPEFYRFYRSLEAYKAVAARPRRRDGARPDLRVLPVLQAVGRGRLGHAPRHRRALTARAADGVPRCPIRCGRRSRCS